MFALESPMGKSRLHGNFSRAFMSGHIASHIDRMPASAISPPPPPLETHRHPTPSRLIPLHQWKSAGFQIAVKIQHCLRNSKSSKNLNSFKKRVFCNIVGAYRNLSVHALWRLTRWLQACQVVKHVAVEVRGGGSGTVISSRYFVGKFPVLRRVALLDLETQSRVRFTARIHGQEEPGRR